MKSCFRSLCGLLFGHILTFSFSAFCQESSYLNFSVADGLPSPEVYQVIQDKRGFIWFATDNGVVKFDGGDFEIINSQRGLSDPVVFGLHEDASGRIWFRTFTGKLSYYLDGKVQRYLYNDTIVKLANKSLLSDIYYDSLDQLWITAGDKIIRIDKQGNHFTKVVAPYSIDYSQYNNDKYLLAYSGPTHRIKSVKISNQIFDLDLADSLQSVSLICSIRWSDNLYISINKELFEYHHNNGLRKVVTALNPIINLSIDKENKLWIGFLNGGLQRIEDINFKRTHNIKALEGKSVTKILQDNEKGFWITTLEKGVFYFPNFSVNKFNYATDSKISSVNSTLNTIITTDYSGKISALTNTGQTLWERELKNPIVSAFKDKSGSIWASTNNETFLFDVKGKILKRTTLANFVDFSATPRYVYAVNTRGVYKFDKTGELVFQKKLNTQFRNIHVSGKDLYLGGKNGLFRYDSTFSTVTELKEFADIKVSSVTSLADSVLLVSTIGNGFTLLFRENANIKRFNSSGGFIANNIYCTLNIDSAIWLGSENGIAVTTIQSLLSGNPQFDFITKYGGLASDKVNFMTVLNDKIWAFGDTGYTQLEVNKIQYINQKPVAYIKEIRMNNTPIELQNSLNFNWQQNNIEIKLGFLSFNNQNILTRFRLTPDDTWTRSSNWTFAFNSLASGQYIFEAEYSTDNLNWFHTPIKVNFRINPPWWNTWYFRLATVLFALAIGVVVYKVRIDRYKEKNEYLSVINEQQKNLLSAEIEATERERTRIAKDLHDGISIDLVSIKLMTHRIANKIDERDAYEIETQIQKTISEIKDIIYGLTPPGLKQFGLSTGLQNYISLITKNHPVNINYSFQGDEITDQHDGSMIFRIIQELITNSVKHAGCKSISIRIEVSETYIHIRYHDDGIGFDPNLVKPGLGLSNIQSRIESLAGQTSFESTSQGTTYQFKIPYKITKQSR